jgi:hypothetical protein
MRTDIQKIKLSRVKSVQKLSRREPASSAPTAAENG